MPETTAAHHRGRPLRASLACEWRWTRLLLVVVSGHRVVVRVVVQPDEHVVVRFERVTGVHREFWLDALKFGDATKK